MERHEQRAQSARGDVARNQDRHLSSASDTRAGLPEQSREACPVRVFAEDDEFDTVVRRRANNLVRRVTHTHFKPGAHHAEVGNPIAERLVGADLIELGSNDMNDQEFAVVYQIARRPAHCGQRLRVEVCRHHNSA